MKKILVLAAHPDDETLGCGGTLLRHKAEGDEINWIIATSMKEEDGFLKKDISAMEKEIKAVGSKYGFQRIERLDISTSKIDKVPMQELTEKISS